MLCERCGCEFPRPSGPFGKGIAYCVPCAFKVRALRKLYILCGVLVATFILTGLLVLFVLTLGGAFVLFM